MATGSANDSTARANASAALSTGAANVSFTSNTFFTSLGQQIVYKAGRMVYLHLLFIIKSEIAVSSNIAQMPNGFSPHANILNIGIINQRDDSVTTVNILTSGAITANGTMGAGLYELNFVYLTA